MADVVEVRIHGVRDHGDYSSLGDAIVLSTSDNGSARTVTMPPASTNPVWLFNWSRASRSLGGLAWYAALPFTLLNVAAQTASVRVRNSNTRLKPDTRPDRRFVFDPMIATVVVIQGLLLTATTLIWTIAIVETVLAHFRFHVESIEYAARLVVVGSAEVLIAWMIVSWLVNATASNVPDHSGGGARTVSAKTRRTAVGAANAAIVVSLSVWLIRVNPGQVASGPWKAGEAPQVPWENLLDFPFASTSAPLPVTDFRSPCYLVADMVDCYARQDIRSGAVVLFDMLSVSILVGFYVSAALAVLIFLRALVARFTRRSDRREHAASLATAALLVFGSWLLLVTLFSATRLGLFWLLQLIVPFIPGGWFLSHHAQPYFVVLPYQLTPYDLSLANFMPLLGLVGLLAFVICASVSGMFVRRSATKFPTPSAKGSRSMRYLHRTVGALDRTLLWIILAAAILFAGAIALFLTLFNALHLRLANGVSAPSEADLMRLALAGGISQLVVLGVTIIAVVMVAFIAVSGGDGKLKQALDVVADIAAFWPREWHPYAGASYRHEVMSGLAATIDSRDLPRVLLIGHSQGSVIACWYATFVTGIQGRIDLVTCGSPILTIYAAVFPRWFNAQRNAETASNLHSWTNVWRATDPIASALAPSIPGVSAGIHDIEAPDPADKMVHRKPHVRGHGNYWTDATQIATVAEIARGRLGPSRDNDR